MHTETLEKQTARRRCSSGFWASFLRCLSRQSSEPGTGQSSSQNSEPKSRTYSSSSTNSKPEFQRDIEGKGPMQIDSPEAIKVDGHSQVVVTRLEISEKVISSLALGVSMLALGIAILSLVLGQLAEREARLAQHDAVFLKAAVIAHGISTDEDQLHKEDK